MNAGRVACCPLVSHDDYADGQTDGRQTVTLRSPHTHSPVIKARLLAAMAVADGWNKLDAPILPSPSQSRKI